MFRLNLFFAAPATPLMLQMTHNPFRSFNVGWVEEALVV
jgi:hypothetical protein